MKRFAAVPLAVVVALTAGGIGVQAQSGFGTSRVRQHRRRLSRRHRPGSSRAGAAIDGRGSSRQRGNRQEAVRQRRLLSVPRL